MELIKIGTRVSSAEFLGACMIFLSVFLILGLFLGVLEERLRGWQGFILFFLLLIGFVGTLIILMSESEYYYTYSVRDYQKLELMLDDYDIRSYKDQVYNLIKK